MREKSPTTLYLKERKYLPAHPAQFCSPGIGDHESDIGSKHIAYIMGWIEYIHGIKIKRRTAFCRIFKEDRPGFIYGRFHAVNDPDYEHEE